MLFSILVAFDPISIIKLVKIRLVYLKLLLKYGGSAPHPNKIVEINPEEVNYSYPSSRTPKLPKYGVIDGDWDLQKSEFGGYIQTGLKERFIEGKDWEKTEYYQSCIEKSNSGEELTMVNGHEDSPQGVLNYLQQVESVYEDIRENGFKSHDELDRNSVPKVHIGREGELILTHGGHRMVMAMILDIDSIPAIVEVRHHEWQSIRHDLYYEDNTSEAFESYCIENGHPDLNDVVDDN